MAAARTCGDGITPVINQHNDGGRAAFRPAQMHSAVQVSRQQSGSITSSSSWEYVSLIHDKRLFMAHILYADSK
eukprot:11219398-Lingulodinium_polyedra.AAC.1